MFAAYVLTITDGQDMQKRSRLGPVAVTSGGLDAVAGAMEPPAAGPSPTRSWPNCCSGGPCPDACTSGSVAAYIAGAAR